jgi:exopolysaccharide biosynthesis polyprenyl glycosylphosphotransferase
LVDPSPVESRWSDSPAIRFGIRPLLVVGDLIACGLACTTITGLTPALGLLVVFVLGLSANAGLYRSRLCLSVLDDLPTILGRWLVAVAGVVLVETVVSQIRWGLELLEWSFIAGTATAIVIAITLRAGVYAAVRRARTRGMVGHPTLILGGGWVAGEIAQTLVQHPEYGLRPVGFLDPKPLLPADGAIPVMRDVANLLDAIERRRVRNLVVAFGSVREAELIDLLRTCDRMKCEIFIVPRLFEMLSAPHARDTVWSMPLIRLRRAAHRTIAWRVKRLVDVVIAAGALIPLGPVMLATALAVRLEGGPGVLFRQERVGIDGRPFCLLKFRSLKPVDDAEAATTWNIAHDHRVGPVGRFLRKTSLDEVPQLINILRGDMSLVGPRPERPHFVSQFGELYPRYIARHRVPSGLTGWAQVHGLRGDTSIVERAKFDNYYIENWSLWLDIKILLRTARSVIAGSGG